jgi:hypothetical protein
MQLSIGGKMSIYYVNHLSEVIKEMKEDETLIIGRKEYYACLLTANKNREIIEEKALGINLYVSRYNPKINKFGSLHIKLDKENQVKLTVPAEATYDVSVYEVLTKPARITMRKHKLTPNSSIKIKLEERSALDLYIEVEEDSFYLGSIELR